MTAKLTEKPRRSALPHPGRKPLALAPSKPRYAAPPVARFVPAHAVGSFVPALTRKAFEKYGFSAAALITDWTAMVGADLARWTTPERLKWPRGNHDDEDVERPGAMLILRVDPARALDVEYRAAQILDRINAYFGYRAIASLRIVQAPLAVASERPASARTAAPATSEATASDPLTAALERLERGVRRDQAARAP